MAITKISEARLRLIRQRQWEDRWGANYVAAIFATPKEAPGLSTGTILRPQKLGGRECHTLSRPETWAALLALYHPAVWDLHEQRILYPTPREHFLFGHPRARSLTFSAFKGTIDVTERLGVLSRHPKVRLRVGNDPKSWPMAPFPYTGDLLLFSEDALGPFLINWTVKDKYIDFRRRGPSRKGKPSLDVDDEREITRHLIESTYYSDAGTRTQQVAGEAIDFELRCNLADLFLDHGLKINIAPDLRTEVFNLYRETIGSPVPAYKVAKHAAEKFQLSPRDAVVLLRQGIWFRDLRVNLFRPILMDKPLRPEVDDALVRYAHWFSREGG